MSRRFALALAVAALLGLAAAPSAGATSLGRLLAPTAACANQNDLDAPVVVQERAMRCMTDFARRHAGKAGLGHAVVLDWSAEDKSEDILRCDSFSHYACGRGFTYWMQRVGYIPTRCWSAGENIAWGTGGLGTVRSIFNAWLHSPAHLENILGHYRQLGVGLRIGGLGGYRGAHVWTQHFGRHC